MSQQLIQTFDCISMSRKRALDLRDPENSAPVAKKTKHSRLDQWLEDLESAQDQWQTARQFEEARHAEPDLAESSLRAPTHPQVMDARSSLSVNTSESISSINAYNAQYEVELRRRRVVWIESEKERAPGNLNSLKEAFFRARASPGPTEEDVEKFRARISKSTNEAGTLQSVLSKVFPLEEIWDREDLRTTPDQQWSRKVFLPAEASLPTRLASPKPDQTSGLSRAALASDNALAWLGPWASPVVGAPDLSFPLCTVEGKGDQGSLKVSRLQNLYSAALMLHMLWHLWKTAGLEVEFFDKAHVCALSLTKESIEPAYYWASQDSEGNTWFYGQAINSWASNSKFARDLREARQCMYNAVNLVLSDTRTWIMDGLKQIEADLRADPSLSLQQPFEPTPPRSEGGLYEGRKRQRSSNQESDSRPTVQAARPLRTSSRASSVARSTLP